MAKVHKRNELLTANVTKTTKMLKFEHMTSKAFVSWREKIC